jgi:ubiquinone/menaquinone biosynthesis C-methylase UbiE
VVLDVGGGTGHYALWLAERDYEVHLIEPVPLHLEQAQRRSSQASRQLASIRSGDARAIDLPDGFADAVLLLGPLYHLVDRAERLSALGEARRVVRPGGVVMTAVISRFASALDGLLQHFFDDPAYRAIVRHDLADGQHRGVVPEHASTQTYFTTAYLHRPDEIADELLEAGLDHEATLAIEGPGWLLQDLDQQWQDPAARRFWRWCGPRRASRA